MVEFGTNKLSTCHKGFLNNLFKWTWAKEGYLLHNYVFHFHFIYEINFTIQLNLSNQSKNALQSKEI